MVKQVELCVASRRYCVDPHGPIDLDISMLASQPLLGPATTGSLHQTESLLYALRYHHNDSDHRIVLPADADYLETSLVEESKGRTAYSILFRRLVGYPPPPLLMRCISIFRHLKADHHYPHQRMRCQCRTSDPGRPSSQRGHDM